MPAKYDVVVVGGGPAGATCARRLALAGLETCVIDREKPPRYKTCGGGLVARAYDLLDVDLDPAIECRSQTIEMNLLDAGLTFRVERPETPIVMTMRARLDDALLQAARQAGAKLLAPCTLEGLQQSDSEATLASDLGPIRAAFVVAADGAASPTAKAAGWPANPHNIPALESELFVDASELERFGQTARFDFDSVPGGYTWVFPKRDHLSVGCLSTRRNGPRLRTALDHWLRRIGLDPGCRREDHGYVIPVSPRPRVAKGRVLLTGDAAGLVDPVTCEGISNAILSGQLAAEAIIESFPSPPAVRAAFQRSLARQILGELRAARFMARLLYAPPGLRAFMFRRVGQRMCDAIGDVFAGRQTYRGLIARPRTYLRMAAGVLSRS